MWHAGAAHQLLGQLVRVELQGNAGPCEGSLWLESGVWLASGVGSLYSGSCGGYGATSDNVQLDYAQVRSAGALCSSSMSSTHASMQQLGSRYLNMVVQLLRLWMAEALKV